jgi:hypothetical protein
MILQIRQLPLARCDNKYSKNSLFDGPTASASFTFIWGYTMRAVVLHEYGGPEKLKFEDNVPEPQISGSTVLIGAAAASVNPIDWKLRSGMRQKDFPASTILLG